MKILSYPSSGSYQGLTFSHNRYGQYVRGRSIPVNPSSSFQATVRARMATNAAAWRLLTAAQRVAWNDFGAMISRTDSQGTSYTLNGFSAYCSVNNNRLAAGDTVISDPVIYTEPTPLVSITPTLTSASFSLAYTATPLPASTRIFWYAGPQRTAGRSFEGDTRLLTVTAAAAASPSNVLAAYTARFGVPVTGNKIFVAGSTYLAGILSAPLIVNSVVS
jgi:hypothetical protein